MFSQKVVLFSSLYCWFPSSTRVPQVSKLVLIWKLWIRINLPCTEPSLTSSTPSLVWRSLVECDSVGRSGYLVITKISWSCWCGTWSNPSCLLWTYVLVNLCYSIASSLRPLLLRLEGDLQIHKGEDLCWNGFGSLWKRIRCVHRSFPCMLRSMEGIE